MDSPGTGYALKFKIQSHLNMCLVDKLLPNFHCIKMKKNSQRFIRKNLFYSLPSLLSYSQTKQNNWKHFQFTHSFNLKIFLITIWHVIWWQDEQVFICWGCLHYSNNTKAENTRETYFHFCCFFLKIVFGCSMWHVES